MPYRYLDDIAISDVAFDAQGASLSEVFRSAADALAGAMVEDISDIEPEERLGFTVKAPELDLLLFDFLSELVYLKDRQGLILCVEEAEISKEGGEFILTARAAGTHVENLKNLRADVKAVTMHQFSLQKDADKKWTARVVLDV